MNLGNIFINPGFELKLFGLQIAGMSNFKIEKLRLGFETFKVGFFYISQTGWR